MKNSNMKCEKIHIIKRIFDIVVSVSVIILSSPFILLALFAIKVEQVLRGRPFDPFFYKEVRMSHGSPFTLYKFNIFKYERVLNLQSKGKLVHTKVLEHDGGLLKVGFLLKQIYMDELPQFYNVLRGDMSVVGPRPVNLEVYQNLKNNNILDKDRVPCGITGYYQSFKDDSNASSVECDKYYADYYDKHSGIKVVLFDIRIILRTFRIILRAKGV